MGGQSNNKRNNTNHVLLLLLGMIVVLLVILIINVPDYEEGRVFQEKVLNGDYSQGQVIYVIDKIAFAESAGVNDFWDYNTSGGIVFYKRATWDDPTTYSVGEEMVLKITYGKYPSQVYTIESKDNSGLFWMKYNFNPVFIIIEIIMIVFLAIKIISKYKIKPKFNGYNENDDTVH